MKTAYRNTLDYKEDVARKLMKSLAESSKLLCAQECKHEITNMEHQVVTDFLRENHVQVFTFLDADVNAEKELELKKLYSSENGIDPPKHEPTPTTTNNSSSASSTIFIATSGIICEYASAATTYSP